MCYVSLPIYSSRYLFLYSHIYLALSLQPALWVAGHRPLPSTGLIVLSSEILHHYSYLISHDTRTDGLIVLLHDDVYRPQIWPAIPAGVPEATEDSQWHLISTRLVRYLA